MNMQERDALYASLHRLAQIRVPNCTLEQVKKIANQFHDRQNTRLQTAYFLYWELAENYVENVFADLFLERLRKLVEEAASRGRKREEKKRDVRDFWMKEREETTA